MKGKVFFLLPLLFIVSWEMKTIIIGSEHRAPNIGAMKLNGKLCAKYERNERNRKKYENEYVRRATANGKTLHAAKW